MCEKPHNSRNLDKCLIPLLETINSLGPYKTILSCCGHGKYSPTIIVRAKGSCHIFEWFSKIELPYYYKNGKVRKRYYVKDKEGYYFIPELIGGAYFVSAPGYFLLKARDFLIHLFTFGFLGMNIKEKDQKKTVKLLLSAIWNRPK